MGGGAFLQAHAEDEPTLRTPRMPPDEYKRIRDATLNKLESAIPNSTVAALIEAPGKKDYGDIDIFVGTDERVNLVEVAKQIGAAGIITTNSKSANLAVIKAVQPPDQVPQPIIYTPLKQGDGTFASNEFSAMEYAQVDLTIVSAELLDWYAFYSSYGDLAGILGHMLRPMGFKINDRGLWLRLPELEFTKTVEYVSVADRDGTVFLSSSPTAVMDFLGCSKDEHQAGFGTLDELYAWAGSCRLIVPAAFRITTNKAHDEKKEKTRPIYRGFFHEWLPAHTTVDSSDADEIAAQVQHLREQYLHEASDFFSVRAEVTAKRTALIRNINNGHAASLLKPLISKHSGKTGKSLNEITRGFRHFMSVDATGQPRMLDQPLPDSECELHRLLSPDQQALNDPAGVEEWARLHWEALKTLERQRGKPVATTDASRA